MKEIKTKGADKTAPRIVDKSSELSSRMKRGLIRAKDNVKNLADDGQVTPEEYAEDKIKYASEDVAGEIAHDSKETIKKTYDGSKSLIQQIKQKRQSGDTIKQTNKSTGKQTFKTMKKNIKTAGSSTGKTVKTSEATARTTVKTTQKAAKTAEQTAKAAKKAAEASAKAAKRSAEAAKAAAKAAAQAAKVAAKAVVAAAKAIASGIKALIAAIAEGGWVAVVAIIVILLIVVVALIVGSGFGIFYSMEDSGSGMTMRDAISEINTEYEETITNLKNSTSYDKLEMYGGRARWPDVLSVYSVKTTSDTVDGQEVATMDEDKFEILRNVFWDMHIISSRTQEKTETVIIETEDEQGNITETTQEVTVTYLYIIVQHKTPGEMASAYGFNNDQMQQLAELTDPKNNRLWNNVLYGFSTGNDQIVEVAKSQLGYEGGDIYWMWYGFNYHPAWCAIFVSWCANECGFIEEGVIPMFAGCDNGVAWFRERDEWRDRDYIPNPGDIIFFDWEYDGYTDTADHVGIVERVDGDTVYTIEGNSGDAVKERTYTVGQRNILGYGVPSY